MVNFFNKTFSRTQIGFSKLPQFLFILLGIRVVVLMIRSFLPLGGAEVFRQTVTLGMSMRYYSRWFLESGATHKLLPAVLDSGETQGILPSEFPFLNFLGAPGFVFGPWIGRAIAIILLTLLVFLLTLWNASIWREKKVAGIPAYSAMLLLPIFSIALGWSGKFMPDFLSALLVTIAVGLSWDQPRRWASFAWATAGLLMKPTAVIVFCLLLLHEQKYKKWKEAAIWLIPATILSALYFTAGAHWIEKYQEVEALVGIKRTFTTAGLVGFFKYNESVRNFYYMRAFFPGGIFLIPFIAAFTPPLKGFPRFSFLWAISLLQILIIAVMDGVGVYANHDYYLVGMAPVFCLLYIEAWERTQNAWIKMILIVGICVPFIEMCAMDLRVLYKGNSKPWLDSQTASLRARHPEIPWRSGFVFRSGGEVYPQLGLYFGERVGSKTSKFAFLWKDTYPTSGCKLIDQSEDLVLAQCTE